MSAAALTGPQQRCSTLRQVQQRVPEGLPLQRGLLQVSGGQLHLPKCRVCVQMAGLPSVSSAVQLPTSSCAGECFTGPAAAGMVSCLSATKAVLCPYYVVTWKTLGCFGNWLAVPIGSTPAMRVVYTRQLQVHLQRCQVTCMLERSGDMQRKQEPTVTQPGSARPALIA
jgi:hypothetical protein